MIELSGVDFVVVYQIRNFELSFCKEKIRNPPISTYKCKRWEYEAIQDKIQEVIRDED